MKPEDIHSSFAEALINQDMDSLIDLYTKDAVFHPGTNQQPVSGHGPILEALQTFIPVAATMKPVNRSVLVNGDTALINLLWKMDSGDGEKQYNAMEVLKLGADGKWRYSIDNPYGV